MKEKVKVAHARQSQKQKKERKKRKRKKKEKKKKVRKSIVVWLGLDGRHGAAPPPSGGRATPNGCPASLGSQKTLSITDYRYGHQYTLWSTIMNDYEIPLSAYVYCRASSDFNENEFPAKPRLQL